MTTLHTSLALAIAQHPSPLVDDEWCWVTDVLVPSDPPQSYGPTYRVHRDFCTQFGDPNTTYLRPIRPLDPVDPDPDKGRCFNCGKRRVTS